MPELFRDGAASPRLIFVDGLPGSGKSTTAQKLCYHLQGLGRPARWYFEHEMTHPVFDDEHVRRARATGPTEPNQVLARALDRIAALVARQQDPAAPVVILESTLFQTAVGTQLLMDLSESEIENHFAQVVKILGTTVAALVYFRPPEVAAALQRTAEKRGAWFPAFLVSHLGDTPRGRRRGIADFAGVIAFFREYRALCDRLRARFPGPQLVLDNSAGDWPRLVRTMTDFLGLPPMIDPPVPVDLSEHTGRYRAPNGDEWTIAADVRGLFFDDAARNRIVPRPGGGFAIEGVGVELDFERAASGKICRVRCTGALPGLAMTWEKDV